MQDTRRSPSTMDRPTTITTMAIIVSILLAGWIARNATLGVQTFFRTLLPMLIFWAFLVSIRAVEVSERLIVVKRRLGAKRYLLADLERVEVLQPDSLRASIRTFGSGGLFGSIGRFWHREYGQLIMNANRRDNHVMLYLGRRKVVVSVDDPSGLATILERRASLQSGDEQVNHPSLRE